MFVFRNPAVEKFVAAVRPEMVFGQVCLRATATGHELCHVDDRGVAVSDLRPVAIQDLRALAQTTAGGAFRPLKSAPSLPSGWVARTRSNAELEQALNHLYPGAIADWYAAQDRPPVTHYREFTARQTGMYRITTMLSDVQAAEMIRACCHPGLCLKRRHWTVEGLPADAAADKSVIPCLEPCAILLEFARKTARMHQEEKVEVAFSTSELETIRQSLEPGTDSTDGGPREADFNAPGNSRRQQLVLGRIQRMLAEAASRRPPSGDSAG